ncbi:hypothetical protein RHAL1_00281 [Beijerinckiaceae bacterium RH AL1]|nr:hypothetical protein RHAL8_00269 [Beijerinckiaceae bacterium RH AL8]VVB42604.1 hypothetical protein RHCH11_RHCH11_00270 [Beijerinckiaceae bacterium RH CH11]VVC53400.1 hypothetical protein RHAL1_00281 [Beijerinckiaceae bacterium RH AL1]
MTLDSNDKIVLVDVGALGGLKPEWQPFHDKIKPIVFEPNPPSAAGLRPIIEDKMGGKVIEAALADTEGFRILNLTASPGCVSLLVPNEEFLRQFSVISAFEVRDRIVVKCRRYDSLIAEGLVLPPDVIKIDVQGAEYDVLTGFGDSLHHCIGIELEAHLYPLYKGQRLLSDYIGLLEKFGLYLRKLSPPVNHFDGFAVEFDAWFTCGPAKIATLSQSRLRKLELLERVWELPERRRIFIPEMFADT